MKKASNKFYLKDTRGHIYDLHIQSIEITHSNYNKYTLALYDSIEIGNEYYVVHQHARAYRFTIQRCCKNSEI